MQLKSTFDPKDVGCPARQPVGMAIVQFSARLVDKAQRLADLANTKLSPVMARECQTPPSEPTEDLPEYSQLFHTLRSSFLEMSAALDSIEAALARVEL